MASTAELDQDISPCLEFLCSIPPAPSSPRRHLPQRRAATLPPRGSPNLEGTRGHPSPATAEEPPASAKPLEVPGPPRVPLSLRGTGSTATQHGTRTVSPWDCGSPPEITPEPPGLLDTHPAVPVPLQEQRIVSPETDSGFVGSEASRVSPTVHTPEHPPPGPGYGPRPCLRGLGD